MPTSPNEDGRPTQGGSAAPVHVMNPITANVTFGGAVEVNNDSGNPIPTVPPSSNNVNTPSIASTATVVAANPARKLWALQNQGTNPLFVLLAPGASTTVFHFILKGATVQDDGSGGFISDDIWKGTITIAGTSPRYTFTEMT